MRARYKTPEEIAAKVDKAKEKIARYSAEAFQAEQMYRYLLQHGAKEDAAIQKEKFETLYKQIEYQQDKRLPKLRDRMGKIQTDLLPWEGNNDKSVAA